MMREMYLLSPSLYGSPFLAALLSLQHPTAAAVVSVAGADSQYLYGLRNFLC